MKKRKLMKKLTLLLTICIMLSMSTSAFSIPTNSRDNSSIPPQNQPHQRIITAPPSGWDALTASDEELAKYNYPPRPTDAQALSEWKNVVKGTWIYPEFEISNSIRSQVNQKVPNITPNLPSSSGTETIDSFTTASSNWSGVATNPGTRARVTGFWRQPVATAATSNRPAYSFSWIGLGGNNNNEPLIQMGTQSNIYADSSGSYLAWYEIVGTNLNEDQILISNFSHMPGDTIYSDIQYTKGSSGSASFYMSDGRTGDVTSFTITNIQYNYNLTSAEWIFERPLMGDPLVPVPNLTKPDVAYVHFAQCKSASTPSGTPSVVSGSASTTEYVTLKSLDDKRTLATPGSLVDAGGGYDNIWFNYN